MNVDLQHPNSMPAATAPFTWGRRHTVLAMSFLAVFIGYTDRVNISVAAIAMQTAFHWSQTTKGFVLSAFFIGYLASLLPSGWLATRIGGKRLLTACVAGWSLFTLLTPLAANVSLSLLIAARIGLGLCEGALFPATYELLSRWAPPSEHSRAVIRLASGIPLGQVGGLMASGWLVAQYGWPAPFYVFGIAGFIWALFWVHKVVADPHVDPALPPAERALFDHQWSADEDAAAAAQPRWSTLLLNRAVWAAIVALFCGNWGLFFLLAWLPSYFREVQGLSIASAGLFSAAPWGGYFLLANLASMISDGAISRGADGTAVRKTVLIVAFAIAATCLYLTREASSTFMAVLLLTASAGGFGAASAAYSANFLELIPNRAGLFVGFGNTLATIPGIVAVSTTGWIVDHTHSYAAAFITTALIAAVGAVFYLFCGSARAVQRVAATDHP
jgi:ACS family sodium-dependent inorganic phosphate cotransporter